MNFGAVMAAVSGRRRVGAGPDLTPPATPTATVQNATPSQIDLVFNEAMAATWSAFAAWAVSAGHSVTGITRTGPTTGYITVGTPFVNGEAARTLGYTQPGTNNMQDLAGNLLGSFSGLAITNNVAPAAGGATMLVQADVANLGADGNPGATIVGYFVDYDTASKVPFGGYANTQYFPGGDLTTGLTLTGLLATTTYYFQIRASYDGTTGGSSGEEFSKVSSA